MATNEFVEAETRERPRVAVLAALAAILTLVTPIVVHVLVIGRLPDNSLTTAFVSDEHRTAVLVGGVLSALGLTALTFVLDFLLRATRRRYPQLPPFLRPMLLVTGIGFALFNVTLEIATSIRLEHFINESSLTWQELRDVRSYGPAIIVIGMVTQFAFVFSFLLIALNAMRVGLLTRFLGYLGAAAAILFIIPVFGQIPIVQAFWLLMFALLLWGKVGNVAEPPAWRVGEAVPWPSAAEMREQRVRAAEARRGGPRSEPAAIDAVEHDEEPDDADAHPAGGGGTSTRPRKRKKRR